MKAKFKIGQIVTFKSHEACGGQYHYHGQDFGGAHTEVAEIIDENHATRAATIRVKKEDYRMLESEFVEYDSVESNSVNQSVEEELPKSLVLLPKEFYVKATPEVIKYLQENNHRFEGNFDYGCAYIVKEEGSQMTDSNVLPKQFDLFHEVSPEHFITSLKSYKVFQLLSSGFYVENDEEVCLLLEELFPLAFAQGENWEAYGTSETYRFVGGKGVMSYQSRMHFEDEEFPIISKLCLLMDLRVIKAEAIQFENPEIQIPEFKIPSISTQTNKANKLFKF